LRLAGDDGGYTPVYRVVIPYIYHQYLPPNYSFSPNYSSKAHLDFPQDIAYNADCKGERMNDNMSDGIYWYRGQFNAGERAILLRVEDGYATVFGSGYGWDVADLKDGTWDGPLKIPEPQWNEIPDSEKLQDEATGSLFYGKHIGSMGRNDLLIVIGYLLRERRNDLDTL
jgi:hypothetical protein